MSIIQVDRLRIKSMLDISNMTTVSTSSVIISQAEQKKDTPNLSQ